MGKSYRKKQWLSMEGKEQIGRIKVVISWIISIERHLYIRILSDRIKIGNNGTS